MVSSNSAVPEKETLIARFGLTDFDWSVLHPLLLTKVRGVKRAVDRRALNGIFWGVIPTCIDHDPRAHWRRPIVMMRHG
jgi:hypothetical protein